MRLRESLYLSAMVLLLCGGAALAYHWAVTERRDREAGRAREEMIAGIDREWAEFQPVADAANTFLVSLDVDNGGPPQLTLTTDAFQARHRAAGGVFRLILPDDGLIGIAHPGGPSFNELWTGSVGGGAVAYRGDVLRVGGGVRGSYTIALVRDLATGRWLVDAFSVSV
ncbi:MAG TPA: hypothetical protein VD866_29770 [Urbifossiella sp.]|nr:hypothetical protein [Urbifossiella sp.]